MSKHWSHKYKDIPFLPDGRTKYGLDCGGLVMMIYREELGIILPEYKGAYVNVSREALIGACRAITEELKKWRKVKTPKEFDLVSFSKGEGFVNYHVGVMCNRTEMIHVNYGINVSTASTSDLVWKDRISGYWRHNER